jgi:NADPH:quinone reductase-like Zn-dependent oxidoreductase
MKAIRIHAYGSAECLSYDEVPDPIAGPKEVVVEVEATGVNPADFKFRSGMLARVLPKTLPFTLGMDIAGRVISRGSEVKTFRAGDRVLAMLYLMGNGGYAERVAVPVEWCGPLADSLDAATAAAMPTPATTAIEQIEDDLGLTSGQHVLVTGATGAVGLLLCFVAKQRGARVTAAVRQKYAEQVRYADDIFILGSDTTSLRARFDCMADTIGGDSARDLLSTLKPSGVVSSVSTDRFQKLEGSDIVIRNFANRPDAIRLARMAAYAASGELQLNPVRTMRLSDAPEAHRQLEAGGAGKVVLIPDRLYGR